MSKLSNEVFYSQKLKNNDNGGMRLNTEVPDNMMRKFKILCAIRGKTMKEYVLECIHKEIEGAEKSGLLLDYEEKSS